jgi:hypothetical protein
MEKARELEERAALPENAGNLAAMMILMAEELVQRAREAGPGEESASIYTERRSHSLPCSDWRFR